MKNITIAAIIILLLGVAAYMSISTSTSDNSLGADNARVTDAEVKMIEKTTQNAGIDTSDREKPEHVYRDEVAIIGKSIESRDIVAYHYGSNDTGAKELLIVGGMHGSYSANTAKVAQEAAEWLKANESTIPANVSVSVMPNVNPDGLAKPAMRFNAHDVDLNRNFACDWKAEGKWQNKKVSGGTTAFSEPESKSIQKYIETHKPAAAIVYYSAAGGVYASSCGGAVSDATRSLLNTYATASGYKAHDAFTDYEISGDMVNWFASLNIPAVSVLLTNHTDTEWTKNEAGLKAVLQLFAK
jgi:predicted deacylase